MSETNTPAPAPPVKGWMAWANRMTAILAVVAALSSGRWGAANLQAILEQGKVNDSWAYFQSKSVKEHNAEGMRDLAGALATGNSDPAAMKALAKHFADEARHEAADKELRDAEARAYEATRDKMVARGFWYEVSFACLQLGVILCTIATAASSMKTWLAALTFGLIGVLSLGNGIYPVVKAPAALYESTSAAMETHPAPPASGLTPP